MENRIKKKTENYLTTLKDNIKDQINTTISCSEEKHKILEFLYNYERLNFTSEDFSKRKRLKNNVPSVDRCLALKSFGTQCTRKRKCNSDFCGTHNKGTPNGIVQMENNIQETNKIKLHLEVSKGIYRYVDNNGKEYKMEDVLDK